MLKKYKPQNASKRHTVLLQNTILTKIKKNKNLIYAKKNIAGRNNFGHLTAFCKGKRQKIYQRQIDYTKLNNNKNWFLIESIEYDPKKSALIMRVYNKEKKEHFYLFSPKNIFLGNLICFNPTKHKNIGDHLLLKRMNIGTPCHSIRTTLNKKYPTYANAAGTFCLIIQHTPKKVLIQLPSQNYKWLPTKTYGSIGITSNSEHFLQNFGKAGRLRNIGKKVRVRGVAMNPVDHPHGGGEGKTSGGRISVTPWGIPTKGKKTRKFKKF